MAHRNRLRHPGHIKAKSRRLEVSQTAAAPAAAFALGGGKHQCGLAGSSYSQVQGEESRDTYAEQEGSFPWNSSSRKAQSTPLGSSGMQWISPEPGRCAQSKLPFSPEQVEPSRSLGKEYRVEIGHTGRGGMCRCGDVAGTQICLGRPIHRCTQAPLCAQDCEMSWLGRKLCTAYLGLVTLQAIEAGTDPMVQPAQVSLIFTITSVLARCPLGLKNKNRLTFLHPPAFPSFHTLSLSHF